MHPMFFNGNDLDYNFLYLWDLKKLFNLQKFHMCTCIKKKVDSLSIEHACISWELA
jgi:hypothetical protein